MLRLLWLFLVPLTLACGLLPAGREVDEVGARIQPAPPAPVELILSVNQDRFKVPKGGTARVEVNLKVVRGGQPTTAQVKVSVTSVTTKETLGSQSFNVQGEYDLEIRLVPDSWWITAVPEGGEEQKVLVEVREEEDPTPTWTPLPTATLAPATPTPTPTRVATATPTSVPATVTPTPTVPVSTPVSVRLTPTPTGLKPAGPEFDFVTGILARLAGFLNPR